MMALPVTTLSLLVIDTSEIHTSESLMSKRSMSTSCCKAHPIEGGRAVRYFGNLPLRSHRMRALPRWPRR
jgi:hypothetical protein